MEQEFRDSIPGLAATISEIDYILFPSGDMAEISLMRRKSAKQPKTTSGIKAYMNKYKLYKTAAKFLANLYRKQGIS